MDLRYFEKLVYFKSPHNDYVEHDKSNASTVLCNNKTNVGIAANPKLPFPSEPKAGSTVYEDEEIIKCKIMSDNRFPLLAVRPVTSHIKTIV